MDIYVCAVKYAHTIIPARLLAPSKYPYHHKRYFRGGQQKEGGGTTTLAIFFIIANELARQHFLHERLYDMGPGTARKGTPPPRILDAAQ